MPNGTSPAPAAAPPHHNPERLLEELLGEVSPAEQTNFEDHLKYRSRENIARMRTEQFVTVMGGTEKIFDEVYHNAYAVATRNGLKGKSDPKSIADTLELVVIEALKKIQRPLETAQWKIFESRKASGGFGTDSDRLNNLLQLAATYFGATQQQVGVLVGSLESGDPLLWNQAVRQFTNQLKDGVITSYVQQHRLRTIPPEKEHLFKAYAVKQLREAHGVEPIENLAKYVSTETQITDVLSTVSDFQSQRGPLEYAARGVRPYQPPQQRR